MDLSALASSVLPYLAQALPPLIQAGKDVTEAVRKTLVDKIGKGAADIACKLWSRISGSVHARKAAEDVAADPSNAKKQAKLEVRIEDLLKADAAFAAELKQLLDAAGSNVGGNVATASGTGAVAVGGDVGGSVSTNVNTRPDER
jgi:hypothetical protein